MYSTWFGFISLLVGNFKTKEFYKNIRVSQKKDRKKKERHIVVIINNKVIGIETLTKITVIIKLTLLNV